jgi:hypothetical protein
MAQLFLPVEHTEADLVLAGQIAERIGSAALYVAWTPAGGRALPEVAAELRAHAPRRPGTLALLFEAVRELWCVVRNRDPYRPALPPAPAEGVPAPPEPAA